jgi:ketosteroid isomerase-like protein
MGRDGNVAAMPSTASAVVSTYFDALARRDLEAMAACWAPDGEEHIAGQVDAVGPDGVRAYFGEVFSAFPDFALTVRQTVAEGDKVAVHWSATGTFAGPAAYQGIEPTGARVELEGLDLLRVADGQIVRNDAFADGVGLARQIGLLPDPGSTAEERGGMHYVDFSRLRPPARWVMPRLLQSWNGGRVQIERTLEEGDEVAGFRVVTIPGHAPGMIALWRESDRLALTSDCFYTLDVETSRTGPPRVPHAAYNQDSEQARASVRKVAALEPAAAWPGHADPVNGDVRAQLEAAADG